MRAEVDHHLLLPSPKDHRVCQSGHTRTDFDGSTTGVIQHTPSEAPATGVPSPASNGTVDEGRPEEDEDHHGNQSTTLSHGSNNDGSSGGSKLHLRISLTDSPQNRQLVSYVPDRNCRGARGSRETQDLEHPMCSLDRSVSGRL